MFSSLLVRLTHEDEEFLILVNKHYRPRVISGFWEDWLDSPESTIEAVLARPGDVQSNPPDALSN